MCDRFHCLPSQLYAEDSGLLRMLALEQLAEPEGGSDVE
jgi:hypothetical protein